MSVSRRAFTIGFGSLPLLQGKTPAAREGVPLDVNAQPEADSPPTAKLFNDHELATVASIAELIIPSTDTPGARQARVAEYLDRILSDSPETVRTPFLEGLWWTDGYARRTAGASFTELPESEQLKIVSELHDSSGLQLETGRSFIRSMKVWTARIYYSTEIGQQELNKGGRVPTTYLRACRT